MTPSRPGFRFKQFHVYHDRCAMKVGTDGILLGAWSLLEGAGAILDIGCGSGLIGLMLAQRSRGSAHITALDVDAGAIRQSRENVAASPWPRSFTIVHQGLQPFAEESSERFDLLVSNPPYFGAGQTFADPARQRARHTAELTHAQLLHGAGKLLADGGRLALVLPYDAGLRLLDDATRQGWLPLRLTEVITVAGRPPQRLLLELGREPASCREEQLVIHDRPPAYSEAFCRLTREFYLKM